MEGVSGSHLTITMFSLLAWCISNPWLQSIAPSTLRLGASRGAMGGKTINFVCASPVSCGQQHCMCRLQLEPDALFAGSSPLSEGGGELLVEGPHRGRERLVVNQHPPKLICPALQLALLREDSARLVAEQNGGNRRSSSA